MWTTLCEVDGKGRVALLDLVAHLLEITTSRGIKLSTVMAVDQLLSQTVRCVMRRWTAAVIWYLTLLSNFQPNVKSLKLNLTYLCD